MTQIIYICTVKTEIEGVYLQGRGGGTPKSAKSGSEKTVEGEKQREGCHFLAGNKKVHGALGKPFYKEPTCSQF